MKALVLGAGGQAGRALVEACPAGAEVRALRRADCDVLSPFAVRQAMEAFMPDVVFNMAAYTRVDRAESEEAAAVAVNAMAPRTIAACAKACGARMVHVSTDCVFDGQSSRPYRPLDECNPINVYGQSKLRGELAVQEEAHEALVVRTAWLYGTEGGNFVETMLQLMAKGDKLCVVDDQVGTPTSVKSLAKASWNLAEADATGVHHYTDAGVASWYDFAVAIGEEAFALGLIGRMPDVVPVATPDYPTAAPRPAHTVLDKSATWAALGRSAPHWRVSLRQVLADKAAHG